MKLTQWVIGVLIVFGSIVAVGVLAITLVGFMGVESF